MKFSLFDVRSGVAERDALANALLEGGNDAGPEASPQAA